MKKTDEKKTCRKLCLLTPVTAKELEVLSLAFQTSENEIVNRAIKSYMKEMTDKHAIEIAMSETLKHLTKLSEN